MESANVSKKGNFLFSNEAKNQIRIRTVAQQDMALIDHLASNAAFRHRHADWFQIEDWIGSETFVMGKHTNGNQGTLVVTAEPAPAAWVRFVAVERSGVNRNHAYHLLHAMFDEVTSLLKEDDITEVGWMSQLRWSDSWITHIGFEQISSMITFGKEDFEMPTLPNPDIFIRPAFPEDLRHLAAIEEKTYDPLWRQSARGLHFGWRESMSFDIAMLNNRFVGFQHSTRHDDTAHLARLTVHPDFQGHGIGSTLLGHAIRHYQRAGIRTMTLNTQHENEGAQRLYKRFGYARTGFDIPLWHYVL
ncbi:MAG: GNAT family N-acetyltransferase [Chloroflexota bacterium]